MSERIVPGMETTNLDKCPFENCEMGADDVDWCTGFWNEMAGEITPGLYPDSPIFSSKEFDWDDPAFLENVFSCPDVEDTFAGTRLNGFPGITDNSFDKKTNEEYSSSNSCEAGGILQVCPPSKASKRKYKRPRKPKTENAQGIPSKRQRTSSAKKAKTKTRK